MRVTEGLRRVWVIVAALWFIFADGYIIAVGGLEPVSSAGRLWAVIGVFVPPLVLWALISAGVWAGRGFSGNDIPAAKGAETASQTFLWTWVFAGILSTATLASDSAGPTTYAKFSGTILGAVVAAVIISVVVLLVRVAWHRFRYGRPPAA